LQDAGSPKAAGEFSFPTYRPHYDSFLAQLEDAEARNKLDPNFFESLFEKSSSLRRPEQKQQQPQAKVKERAESEEAASPWEDD